ncbi:hypothetical protein [Halobaculum limi]|uniref:hypothetical protein n=1 Tax=Halobaculum limi TaxID=3031916 RepID=UPI0024072850|nr:hypothetical protein [Halobaculum sp. YSMS11]
MSEKWTLRGSGVGVVAALGGIEVVLRSLSTPAGAVADVVASTLSIVVPVVVDATVLEWGIGWLFLATLAYQTFYRVDALLVQYSDSRRLAYLSGSVLAALVGIGLTWAILGRVFSYASTPAVVVDSLVWAVAAAVVALYAASTTFTHDLKLAVVVGTAMVVAALLYPLPEVAVVVWFLTGLGVNQIPTGPQIKQLLNDPIERLMLGVAGSMTGTSIHLLYVVFGILLSTSGFFYVPGSIPEALRGLSIGLLTTAGDYAAMEPSAVGFVVCVAVVPTLYGVWYWLRVAERLPFSLGLVEKPATGGGGASQQFHVRKLKLKGGINDVEITSYRPIPPGYGLPVSLLVGLVVVFQRQVGALTANVVPLGYVLAALALTLLAALTILALFVVRLTAYDYDQDLASTDAPSERLGEFVDDLSEWQYRRSTDSLTGTVRTERKPLVDTLDRALSVLGLERHHRGETASATHIAPLAFTLQVVVLGSAFGRHVAATVHGLLSGGPVPFDLLLFGADVGTAILVAAALYVPAVVQRRYEANPFVLGIPMALVGVVVAHLWVGGTIGAPSPVVTAVGGVAVVTGVGAWKAYEVVAGDG